MTALRYAFLALAAAVTWALILMPIYSHPPSP